MRKVVLLCSAGMSTSMLVSKMEKAAEAMGYECTIAAFPASTADKACTDADIILLGPQIRFNLDQIKAQFPDKIVSLIDMTAYGRMDGEKVIKTVKELLGD